MNDLSASEAAFAGGFLGSMFMMALFALLFYYVISAIASWKIFEKAGEKGWKALIPIYNTYILYKIVGMQKWFWVIIAVSFFSSFIASIMGQGTQVREIDMSTGGGVFVMIMAIAVCIFAVVISIMYANRTSKAFGHGILFTLGLIFLSGIFMLVLGFDSSKYNKKLVKSWEK